VIRLKTRGQFQAVLAGRVLSRTDHFVLHCTGTENPQWLAQTEMRQLAVSEPLGSGMWLGAMVPKRWAKRAVTRNTIRRQIYAVGTANAYCLPHGAHLVRLRCAFDQAKYVSATSQSLRSAIRQELLQLFDRVQRPTIASC
jgi:ribonuclease P protein component